MNITVMKVTLVKYNSNESDSCYEYNSNESVTF